MCRARSHSRMPTGLDALSGGACLDALSGDFVFDYLRAHMRPGDIVRLGRTCRAMRRAMRRAMLSLAGRVYSAFPPRLLGEQGLICDALLVSCRAGRVELAAATWPLVASHVGRGSSSKRLNQLMASANAPHRDVGRLAAPPWPPVRHCRKKEGMWFIPMRYFQRRP